MMLTLLRAGWHGRAVHVFINNGDGTFRDETSSRIPNGGNVAANGQFVPDLELTDFNNDGHLDICMIYGTAKNREDAATFGAAGFNEAYYLNSNADVKALVTGGQLASGLDHYLMVGRSEGRLGMARSRHSIIMKNVKNYIAFYLN